MGQRAPVCTLFPYTTLFRSGCRFAVFVGHVENDPADAARPRGDTWPFEVWVNGAEQPRGLGRSEEHTSELQSQSKLVCRHLLEKKKERQLEHESQRRDLCDRLSAEPSARVLDGSLG